MAADLTKIQSDITSIAENSSAFVSDIGAMLSILQKMDANISSNKPSSKNGSTVNASGITSMLKAVNAVSPKFQTLSNNLTDVNRALSTINATLDRFNQNIQSGPTQASNSSTGNAKNVNTRDSSFTNVKQILNDIKDTLKQFHDDFVNKSANTGDEKLDKAIQRQNKKEEKEKLEYRKALYNYTHGKATAKDLERIKEHKKQEKRRKKLDNEKPVGASIASAITSGFSSIMKGGMNASSLIDNGIGALTKVSPWFALLNVAKSVADAYDREQGYGRDYARTHGGGRAGRNDFMDVSSRFRRHSKLSSGYTAEEFYKASSNISDATGRQMYRVTDENIKSGIDLTRLGIEGVTAMFDTFGQSLKSTDDYFLKLYQRSGKTGVSFRKMTEAIKNNLKMAQTYTFSKGIDGLQKMAETSTRLKYNMSEVAKFAEKVNTVEGAIKASASLSVLGGDFAQFSNPMALMYESLNDIEGLNERMIEMFSRMATFDKSKGQIDISGIDRIIIRAASEAMGVDANEMMNIAMNTKREGIAESQARRGGITDSKLLGYIKNLAQIDKQGNAYISGQDGEPVYLEKEREKLENLAATLKKESEARTAKDAAGVGDIYASTRSIYDFLNDNLAGVSSKLQALVTRFIHGGSMNSLQKEKWNEIRADKERFEKLKQEMGGRAAVRRAVKNEQFDNEIAKEKFDGNIDRMSFFLNNENRKVHSGGLGATGYSSSQFISDINNGIYDKEIEKQKEKGVQTHHVGTADVHGEHLRILQNNESVLTGDATRRLGVKNINRLNSGDDPFANVVRNVLDEKFNYLKALSVAPPKYASVQSSNGNQKLSIEPISLNVTGQFNLISPNGQFRNISLDDIDTRALKKVILDTITDNIPSIMRKNAILSNKGYDMEHDTYRGSMQVPYV